MSPLIMNNRLPETSHCSAESINTDGRQDKVREN